MKYEMRRGFTMVEVLVVMSVLSVVGVFILSIFTNSLRGNNRTQIVELIKQNGQAILETMDKTIRNSDRVVCISNSNQTITIIKNGVYTKFSFIASVSGSTNGYFQQEAFSLPSSPPPGTDANLYIRDFETTVCESLAASPQVITDTNTQTGVSIDCQGGQDDSNRCSTNPIFSIY